MLKKILIVSVVSMLLASCTVFNGDSKDLSDKSIPDSQISEKVIDGKTTVSSLDELIGKQEDNRYAIRKTFPDGKLSVASYIGFLNNMTGTYAHRVLSVVYGADNVVINHGLIIKDLWNKNKYNSDYVSARNLAFTDLEKGSDKTKVISLLGNPNGITFSDKGNVLLVYSKTDVTRDGTSYIPVFNMIKGTESGTSERLYVEMDKSDKVVNIITASVSITQGRGLGNADSYVEKYDSIKMKYE